MLYPWGWIAAIKTIYSVIISHISRILLWHMLLSQCAKVWNRRGFMQVYGWGLVTIIRNIWSFVWLVGVVTHIIFWAAHCSACFNSWGISSGGWWFIIFKPVSEYFWPVIISDWGCRSWRRKAKVHASRFLEVHLGAMITSLSVLNMKSGLVSAGIGFISNVYWALTHKGFANIIFLLIDILEWDLLRSRKLLVLLRVIVLNHSRRLRVSKCVHIIFIGLRKIDIMLLIKFCFSLNSSKSLFGGALLDLSTKIIVLIQISA